MNARGEYGVQVLRDGPDPIPPLPAAFRNPGTPAKKPWETVLIGGLVVAGAGLGIYWLKRGSETRPNAHFLR